MECTDPYIMLLQVFTNRVSPLIKYMWRIRENYYALLLGWGCIFAVHHLVLFTLFYP